MNFLIFPEPKSRNNKSIYSSCMVHNIGCLVFVFAKKHEIEIVLNFSYLRDDSTDYD